MSSPSSSWAHVLMPHALLVAFAFVTAAQAAGSSTPYTPQQYRNSLDWGFDTDFFKNTPPLRAYNDKVMPDLKKRGVKNLRLRSRADVFGYATSSFDSTSMDLYLDGLETVVTSMIDNNMRPVISWIHHNVEEDTASDEDRDNFVDWWTRVAERMKKYSYELSFNLFTEIGEGALRDVDKYNDWTRRVIKAIRGTGQNNKQRIIILGAPSKKSTSLFTIANDILEGDDYLMAEWHLYASGPNQKGGQKNWKGKGSAEDKENVDSVMDEAVKFTKQTGVPTWIGAWMPYDNIDASLTQSEVLAFGCYFNTAARSRSIPWSMNKLDNFYDTEKNEWISSTTIGRGKGIKLSMTKVLESSLCTTKGGAAEEGEAGETGSSGSGVVKGLVIGGSALLGGGLLAASVFMLWKRRQSKESVYRMMDDVAGGEADGGECAPKPDDACKARDDDVEEELV